VDIGMSTAIDTTESDEFDHARHDRLIRTTVAALNDLGVPALVTDLSGVIQASNSAVLALYGCTTGALVGRPMISSVHVADDDNRVSLTDAAIANGRWQGYMTVITPNSGTLRTNVRATLLLDEGGQSAGVLVIILIRRECPQTSPTICRSFASATVALAAMPLMRSGNSTSNVCRRFCWTRSAWRCMQPT
jgi:PAS domain-containing protein